MKKRITIVTWLGIGNFGTSLQSYALHYKLESLGYDVAIVDHMDASLYSLKGKCQLLFKKCKSIIKCVFFYKRYQKQKYREYLFRNTRKYRKIQQFNSEYYNEITVNSVAEYKNLLLNTDVFVTGSDQIWNCYHHFDPFYFLAFAKDKKRVAYASSIGTTSFPDRCRNEVKSYLLEFSHIGVRENSAVSVIKNLIERDNVRQVVDPTFLLTKEEWTAFYNKLKFACSLPEKYILCYFIGDNPEYKDNLEEVKKRLNIDSVVLLPALENDNFNSTDALVIDDASPIEFVYLLNNASCVCTDSFHATALSINLNKNFVEFKRFKDNDESSQNSRLYDMLSHYGLMDRFFCGDKDNYTNQIDYKPINEILNADREDCLQYLINSIKY